MILKEIILNLINNNIRNKAPKVIKSEHANVEEALLDAIFIPYQVIEIDCTQQFLEDNFDLEPGPTMGLGKNVMLGLAICNGNNGTRNRGGRVAIQYNEDYPELGEIGGYSKITLSVDQLPPHRHPNGIADDEGKSFVYGPTNVHIPGYATKPVQVEAGDNVLIQGLTGEIGEGEDIDVMQPFIVTVFCQRV